MAFAPSLPSPFFHVRTKGSDDLQDARPCSCFDAAARSEYAVLAETNVPLDVVLAASERLAKSLSRVRHCSRCWCDDDTIAALANTAARLLCFYKAACTAYCITASPPRWSPSDTFSYAAVQCSPATMALGPLTLDAAESCVLAGQLLTEGLYNLHAALEDLQALLDDDTHNNMSHRPISSTRARSLLADPMDGIARLSGQMRAASGQLWKRSR
ncbi:hypothetical protein BFW01_g2802 [Lasiodiplodia theobromae]|uniref:Uncharacterized protein n=1 Tax=Lasiodiplodia theobromae TaxID=45133 RepID=A0A5N5DDF8_9PEZI|nr:hypothetical protein DBV05_g5494 [Lasiodiplodia theobromae]KAF9631940.1 hypothetical protein BFW01_g2802 [Lasiodiplodia theobromae]